MKRSIAKATITMSSTEMTVVASALISMVKSPTLRSVSDMFSHHAANASSASRNTNMRIRFKHSLG